MDDQRQPVEPAELLIESRLSNPMRVVTVYPVGANSPKLPLVGIQPQVLHSVSSVSLAPALITSPRWRQIVTRSYAGVGELVRLGLQGYALGIAYEFDLYFGLSNSRADPLPDRCLCPAPFLENRAHRLTDNVGRLCKLVATAPQLPGAEDPEEMREADREKFGRLKALDMRAAFRSPRRR